MSNCGLYASNESIQRCRAKLLRERGGYSRIRETPPNIIAALFLVAPSMTALGFNAVPIMKLVHSV